jgi:outer membrane scaffolding protein for murein synthesis (MipA/OmpV family)
LPIRFGPIAILCAALINSTPVFAQNASEISKPAQPEPSVFDGDWLAVGIAGAYEPSYDGSDDYSVFPVAGVIGKVKGIGINPRPSGLALDFVPDSGRKVTFDFGPSATRRSDRTRKVEDEQVAALGKLKHAIEVGVAGGVSISRLRSPHDRLSFSIDASWDVNGAHSGSTFTPSISYLTPFNKRTFTMISLWAEHGDGKFMDYYYSVTPAGSTASGLPAFQAQGGWKKAGVNLLVGFDLDGNLQNGGFMIGALAGYSRMLGDAKDSPITSLNGSANQWELGAGVGYLF